MTTVSSSSSLSSSSLLVLLGSLMLLPLVLLAFCEAAAVAPSYSISATMCGYAAPTRAAGQLALVLLLLPPPLPPPPPLPTLWYVQSLAKLPLFVPPHGSLQSTHQ